MIIGVEIIGGKYYKKIINKYCEEETVKMSKDETIEYLEKKLGEEKQKLDNVMENHEKQNIHKYNIMQAVAGLIKQEIIDADVNVHTLTADATCIGEEQQTIILGKEYTVAVRTAEPKK